MTNEERDIIAQFMGRVSGQQPAQQSAFGGSVPATVAANPLPPVDPEADRFIADQFSRYPEARYRITQMAFVQEAALAEAQNRIKRLEWELDQTRHQAAQQQAQPQQSRGLFAGLFGGGSAPQQPPQPSPQSPPGQQYAPQQQYAPPPGYGTAPPPPQYPPNYQPGMFQRSGGSGFLGSALTTAAGVAGGVVVGNALMDMFSGHREGGGFGGGLGGGLGGGGFGGAPTNETIINNYGDQPAGGAADPWAGQGAVPGADWANQPAPPGQDAWGAGATPPDPGFDTSSNADPGGDAGWDNTGGGGFDDDNNNV